MNRIRDAEAEAGLTPRRNADPYGPYPSPSFEGGGDAISPGYNDAFNASREGLPLVANASPFQRADMYEEEFEERESLRNDRRSRFTNHRDDSVSNFGTESYAPYRNMFHNADKKGLHLRGEDG